jgi:hypothetical protein
MFDMKALSVITTVEDFLQPLIDDLITALQGLEVWMQAVAILLIGVFAIVGLVVFFKRFIGVLLFLVILGGIVYYLYTQTDIISGLFIVLTDFSGIAT